MERTHVKSKSQQLRSVLYVYWVEIGRPDDFDSYYAQYMDAQITALKTQLSALDED